MKIVGIQFDFEDQLIYYNTNQLDVKKNITVIAETDKGLEFGKVVTDMHPIDIEKLNEKPKKIIRIASKKDYLNFKGNKKLEQEALKTCKKLVSKYHLDMHILDVHVTFEKEQIIFHFTADNRIDFRDLAKELASIYKTRIELRQIGVRDKAKKVCGIGSCGQKLCCSRFLKDFESVSISMAKNQNLSLNPNKINGVCGRLLCCLTYENECYSAYKKKLPNVGQTVTIEEGTGQVTSIDILNQTYYVEIPHKGNIKVSVKDGSA